MKKIILGSNSPRRKEILSFFRLPFAQIASYYDENQIVFSNCPKEYVQELSLQKAYSLLSTHQNDLILTADTIVYKEGKIYGKPQNLKEAKIYLSELQNSWHSVFTALTLTDETTTKTLVEETSVLFNPLTPDEIDRYIHQIHILDKAGAYAIQTGAGLIVKAIKGCYYNVMGLPINSLRTLFLEFDIDLWDYLK